MSTEPQSLRGSRIALAGLSAVFLVEMLDNSILTVALPTIGRELSASTAALQWVTGSYTVVFGGLMLVFGSLSDRFGRRRIMLVGLVLLGVASLATVAVTTVEQLIAVRVASGIAAAMTTPGSMALAFRLFRDDDLRVRALNLISTVGLVGLAIGPTVGGLVLAFAPWQVLLLVNVPLAILAFLGIRAGIGRDAPEELHRDPVDVVGGLTGAAAVALVLVAPTLFVEAGVGSWAPWTATAGAVVSLSAFVVRQRTARSPLLDLALIARPLVSSGLAFRAASGLAMAGLSYLVTLQLQLEWGWPAALAAIGMLPQVIVLVVGGLFVPRFVRRVGLDRAAWISASSVVAGLAVYAAFGRLGYAAVAVALVLVAAGMRVVGVVAGTNVLRGLPEDRTTIGSALIDTAGELTTGLGIAVAGTVLAAMFTGDVTATPWTSTQTGEFDLAVTVGGAAITAIAASLVIVGFRLSRRAASAPEPATEPAESV